MKKKYLIILIFILLITLVCAVCQQRKNTENFAPFTIYNNVGKVITFEQMVKEISKVDICLMGEFHNDPMAHWLEMRLLKRLYKLKGKNLIFGGEMWEKDQQDLTDEYVKDKLITIDTYKSSSTQWKNFTTDYQQLMEFCREKNIPFYCTNVPRRYANLVSKKGDSILNKLSPRVQGYLPPLPILFNFSEKSYEKFAEMLKIQGMHAMKKSATENMIKAQALKDATMAYWIIHNMKKQNLFLHINGDFHSAYRSGINYYLKQYSPQSTTKIISVHYTNDEIIDYSKGDYNIVIANDIPKSY